MPFKKQLEKPHRAQTGNMNALPNSSKTPYNMKQMLQKYQDKVASIEHRRRWHNSIQKANYITEDQYTQTIIELAKLAGINQ